MWIIFDQPVEVRPNRGQPTGNVRPFLLSARRKSKTLLKASFVFKVPVLLVFGAVVDALFTGNQSPADFQQQNIYHLGYMSQRSGEKVFTVQTPRVKFTRREFRSGWDSTLKLRNCSSVDSPGQRTREGEKSTVNVGDLPLSERWRTLLCVFCSLGFFSQISVDYKCSDKALCMIFLLFF